MSVETNSYQELVPDDVRKQAHQDLVNLKRKISQETNEYQNDPNQEKKLEALLKEWVTLDKTINDLYDNNQFVVWWEGHIDTMHIDPIKKALDIMKKKWLEYVALEIPSSLQDDIDKGNFDVIEHSNYKEIAKHAHSLWLKVLAVDVPDGHTDLRNPRAQNERDQYIAEQFLKLWDKKCFSVYWAAHIHKWTWKQTWYLNKDYSKKIEITRFVQHLKQLWKTVWTICNQSLSNSFQETWIKLNDKQVSQFLERISKMINVYKKHRISASYR